MHRAHLSQHVRRGLLGFDFVCGVSVGVDYLSVLLVCKRRVFLGRGVGSR